jgi:hypothetical protein
MGAVQADPLPQHPPRQTETLTYLQLPVFIFVFPTNYPPILPIAYY